MPKLKALLALLVLLSVPARAGRLCAFYLPETDADVLFALDDAGRLHEGGLEGWGTVNTPCRGGGPYDLLVLDRPEEAGRLNILVIDGAGQLYEVSAEEWRPVGEPLAGEAPYRLGGYAVAEGAAEVYALDAAGWLWRFIEGWEAVSGPIGGTPPYDLDLLHYAPTGVSLFLAMDSAGVLHTRFGEGWEPHAGFEDAAGAPYLVSGFYDPASLAVFILVMDSTGQVHSDEDGVFVAVGEPFSGEPPFDLATLVHEHEDRYYIAALSATGNLAVMRSDGGWETFFESF